MCCRKASKPKTRQRPFTFILPCVATRLWNCSFDRYYSYLTRDLPDHSKEAFSIGSPQTLHLAPLSDIAINVCLWLLHCPTLVLVYHYCASWSETGICLSGDLQWNDTSSGIVVEPRHRFFCYKGEWVCCSQSLATHPSETRGVLQLMNVRRQFTLMFNLRRLSSRSVNRLHRRSELWQSVVLRHQCRSYSFCSEMLPFHLLAVHPPSLSCTPDSVRCCFVL